MITTFRGFSVLLSLSLALPLGLSLTGCAAFDKGALDARVASQVMVSRLDPPPGCEFLGGVKGVAPLGELGEAHGDVLRNAVLRGGNYVAVDVVERPLLLGLGSYVVRGRLFACPVRAPEPAAAQSAPPSAPPVQAAATPAPAPAPGDAAAPRSCEPECAAGFTCQLGACLAGPAPQAASPAN